MSNSVLPSMTDDQFFDIHCKDEDGNILIIEIQRGKEKFFKDRSVYYSTFPIRSQGEKRSLEF